MEKKIEDYLHLYINADMIAVKDFEYWHDDEGQVIDNIKKGTILTDCENRLIFENSGSIQPILRPLSSMTEEEKRELYFIVFKRQFIGDNITHRDIGTKSERYVLWSGLERLFIYKDGYVGADSDLQYVRVPFQTVFVWQLSKGFDLFGLIESNLAVEKK